jgi:hypothetical protein
MMVKPEPFDSALYLTSPSSQEELLNDALASGEARYVSQALGVIARARGMTAVLSSRSPNGSHAPSSLQCAVMVEAPHVLERGERSSNRLGRPRVG